MAPFFERVISLNKLGGTEYVEPYAGGASLALSLLFKGVVSRVHLSDLSPSVYWFWWAVVNRPRELVRFLTDAPLTIDEWQAQREVYRGGPEGGRIRFAKSVLYLNRTNYSGIMNAGVIGGLAQEGKWKMDARFNRTELARRIERIAARQDDIAIYHLDALDFLSAHPFQNDALVYLDPPYFGAGQSLYLNSYTLADHEAVCRRVTSSDLTWIVSYDDTVESRRLYGEYRSRRIELLHTARSARVGREVMFFAPGLRIPRMS